MIFSGRKFLTRMSLWNLERSSHPLGSFSLYILSLWMNVSQLGRSRLIRAGMSFNEGSCEEVSMSMDHYLSLSTPFAGLSGIFWRSLTPEVGPRRSMFHASGEMLPLYLLIAVQIKKEKSFL